MRRYKLQVEPGSAKNYKTGSWRVYRPVLDQEKCIGCGICGQVCPEGICFSSHEENLKGKIFFNIDLDYCKGCGLCAYECPLKAIRMVLEEK